MIRKDIVVHTYVNERNYTNEADFLPIISLGIKERTHLGTSGYLFELSIAEADEIAGKLEAAVRRNGRGNRDLSEEAEDHE